MGLVCSTVDCVDQPNPNTLPLKHPSIKSSNNQSFTQSANQRISFAWLDEDAMKTTQPLHSVATSVVSSPRQSFTNHVQQSVHQTMNHAIKHSTEQSIAATNNQSRSSGTESPQTSPSDNQSTNQSIKQAKQSYDKDFRQRHFPKLSSFEERECEGNQPIDEVINRPVNQLIDQSINEAAKQSAQQFNQQYSQHKRTGSDGFVIHQSTKTLTKRHSAFVPNQKALKILQRQFGGYTSFTKPSDKAEKRSNKQANEHIVHHVEAKTVDVAERKLYTSPEPSPEHVDHQIANQSPPHVSLHAIVVQPDASPLDLGPSAEQSKTQVLEESFDDHSLYQPVDETYNCHEHVESPLIYQAIHAYHREHKDEGLGPSWWSVNLLRARCTNNQRVIHIQSHDDGINQMYSEWIQDLSGLKHVEVDQPCSVLGFLSSTNQGNAQPQAIQRC